MTSPAFLLIAGAAWGAASLGLALLLGRVIRDADQPDDSPPDDLCALIQPETWGPAAIDAEFRSMAPGFVTAETFALDAQINRRAQRTWWA